MHSQVKCCYFIDAIVFSMGYMILIKCIPIGYLGFSNNMYCATACLSKIIVIGVTGRAFPFEATFNMCTCVMKDQNLLEMQ